MKQHAKWNYLAFFTALSFCLLLIRTPSSVLAAQSAYKNIQGENYNEDSSKGVSASWENGGDIVSLGWIDNGDYACYKNISFDRGISKMKIRYSKKCIPNVQVKVLLDNPKGGTLLTDFTLSSATGTKWTDFETLSFNLKKDITGTHDIYLKFSSLETSLSLLHIDWFVFSPGSSSDSSADSSSASSSLPPAGLTLKDSDGVTYKVLKGSKSVAVTKIPKSMELWYMKNTLTVKSDTGIRVTLNVTTVASNAAKNCKNLKVVYFGEKITTVSAKAFAGCKNLNTLVFQGTAAKKNVKPSAFYDIKKKADIYVPKKNLSYFKKIFKEDRKTKKKSFKFHKYAVVG